MTASIDTLIEQLLPFDRDAEIARTTEKIRELMRQHLRRRGLVVAMSGGIDSSVCAALAVKALGPDKVFGLLMPERDSSSESVTKGKLLAEHLGIRHTIEDIAPTLEAIGCYRWRDEAFEFEGVRLRAARQDDAGVLLAWRNQPDVRLYSRTQDIIAPDSHARWLRDVIASPNRHLMIGCREGKPVGVVRLDVEGDAGEVSIYLAPEARGRDNGTALLRAQEAWLRASLPGVTRLIAVVLGDNVASRKLFLKNGYTCLPTHYEKRITR